MREFLRQHGKTASFLFLAIAVVIALNATANHAANQLYRSQLGACYRSNVVRAESNRRIPSHKADTAVLRKFLVTARAAREATHLRSDLRAAREYSVLIHTLDTRVKFQKVQLINCHDAIKKP